MSNITLLIQPAKNNFITSCALQMPVTSLIGMTEMACSQILRFCHPDSSGYITPKDYCGQSFDIQAENDNYLGIGIERLEEGMRGTWGQHWYIRFWDQIDIINQYVALVNAHPDTMFLGEESFTRQMVYNALRCAHNWKVKCIEDTHKHHGKSFGSATGWQTHNLFTVVADWPQHYPKYVISGAVLLLPCERPDYMKE